MYRSIGRLTAVLVLLSACAEGTPSDDEDAGGNDLGGELDRGRDLPGEPADDPEPDPVVDSGIDPEPEPDLFDPPDLDGECVPFSVVCTSDGYALQRCSAEGALFEPSSCAFEEVCVDDEEGVRCVDCTPDVNCRDDEPECEPNSNFCLDFETAAQCTSDGRLGNTVGCGGGRCFGGGCNSTGNQTGEVCDNGNGCRGRFCICGEEDGPNDGTVLCSGNLAIGYCTTSACDVNGCHPDNEICTDFALSGAHGGGHKCLLVEDCATRLGSCSVGARGDGHVCRELPSTDAGGSRSWGLGCWVPASADPDVPCADNNCLAPIGAACNSNADCIGGFCFTGLEGGISYCAAPCSEVQGCPSYAACVRIDEASDNHFCLARAQILDCPRLENFYIVPRSLPQLGGVSTASVCFERDD